MKYPKCFKKCQFIETGSIESVEKCTDLATLLFSLQQKRPGINAEQQSGLNALLSNKCMKKRKIPTLFRAYNKRKSCFSTKKVVYLSVNKPCLVLKKAVYKSPGWSRRETTGFDVAN